MKKQIILVLSLLISGIAYTQDIGIGTFTPDNTSILDLTATDKGFLPPRLTQSQRNNIVNPAEGLTVYNTTIKCVEFWDSEKWVNFCGAKDIVTVEIAGRVWMAHNLGADYGVNPNQNPQVYSLHGNLYQWGKKDAVADISTPEIWQPYGVYTSWPTNPSPDSSWNSGTSVSPVKSINDPCPEGFRIPTQSEWQYLIDNTTRTNIGTDWTNNTSNFGTAKVFTSGTFQLVLPAAGTRNDSGVLNLRGTSGSYWSSTESGSNILTMYFTSSAGLIFANRPSNRLFGASVRCIAE